MVFKRGHQLDLWFLTVWHNARAVHDGLRPLKVLVARMLCPYLNLGRYVGGRPLTPKACGWTWPLSWHAPRKNLSSESCTLGWPTERLLTARPRW